MNLTFELEIVRNPALGALALWGFARAYFDQKEHTEGPDLPQCLLVLPMVFHRRTAETLYHMQSQSGLLKALLDHPEIPAGLQLRVESTADLTFASLAVATASSLLEVDPAAPWPRYVPQRKTLPAEALPVSEEPREILQASRRLGVWFAGEDTATLLNRLHVRI